MCVCARSLIYAMQILTKATPKGTRSRCRLCKEVKWNLHRRAQAREASADWSVITSSIGCASARATQSGVCGRAMEPCVRNSAHVSPVHVCVIARACLVTGFESALHSCAAMRLLGGYTIRVLDQFTIAKIFLEGHACVLLG